MKIGYILLGLLALAGFLMSAVVNIGAYVGINLWEAIPAVQLLHISSMGLVWICIGAGINRDFRMEGKRSSRMFFISLPVGIRRLIKAVGVYTALNFGLMWCGQVSKPVPQRISGTFYEYSVFPGQLTYISDTAAQEESIDESRLGDRVELDDLPVERSVEDQISIFRPISEDRYYQRTIPIARGFSGHWMLFHLIPAVYFLYHKGEIGKPKRTNGESAVFPPTVIDRNWIVINEMMDVRDSGVIPCPRNK